MSRYMTSKSQRRRYKKRKKSCRSANILTVICCTAAVLLLSTCMVMATRAFIYNESDWTVNSFGHMTYTDIGINEPNGDTFALTVDSSGQVVQAQTTIGQKEVVIKNNNGNEKKPVFVRAYAVMTVYDSTGVNVITQSVAPNCSLSFTADSGWVKDTASDPGYYYYSSTLLPGEETTPLMTGGSVGISHPESIPDGSIVSIVIIADAIQAVSMDSSVWTAADYSTANVTAAWGKTPTLGTLSAAQLKTKVSTSVTWTF